MVTRFKHDFVVSQFKMGVKQSDSKSFHHAVFLENFTDIGQTIGIAIVYWLYIVDVFQSRPLHRRNRYCVHVVPFTFQAPDSVTLPEGFFFQGFLTLILVAERDTGLDDVRASLLATRAEAVPEISAAHPQPGRPSGARPWGDVIARTFRLKG